jgi:hypothetical protein
MMILDVVNNELKFINSNLPLKSIRLEVMNGKFYQNNSNGIIPRLINPITVYLFSNNIALPQYIYKLYHQNSLLDFSGLSLEINGLQINSFKSEIRIFGNFIN